MRGWLAPVVVLTIAACTSGDDETTEPTIATTAAPTTSTTTTTTSTTTTSTSTTTTTTTVAPTTTVDPTEELIAAIERDLNLGEQALLASGADPGNQALRSDLQTFFRGPALAGLEEVFDSITEDGLRVRPSREVMSVVRVRSIVEVPVDLSAQPAIVELCRVDAGVIYEPLVGGDEIVINDAITVEVTTSRVFLVDEVWVLDGGELIETLDSSQGCD